MQIKYSDIPQWLQNSDFYRNLASDEESGLIEIPADCFRETIEHVQSPQDLGDILRVMRFWMNTELPQSVLEFCYANDWSVWNPIFVEIVGEDARELNAVKLACSHTELFSLSAALSSGRPELVTFWLRLNMVCSEHNKYSIAHACRFGRLDLVETLRKRGFSFDAIDFWAAAQYGHLYVLRFLHAHGCPYDGKAQTFAARGGHVDCMIFLLSIGSFLFENVTLEYAVPQHYAHIQTTKQLGHIDWTDDFSVAPPVGGYLKCLQFALQNGCRIHQLATRKAALYGLLDCLQLLHQYHAPWEVETFVAAAYGGHLDCLMYLYQHNCPMSAEAFHSAAENGHLYCMQYLHNLVSSTGDFFVACCAASKGHLSCLQWLHQNDYAWNHVTMARAASGGHLDCVMYLHTNGCAWEKDACENAAEGGHLSCLQY